METGSVNSVLGDLKNYMKEQFSGVRSEFSSLKEEVTGTVEQMSAQVKKNSSDIASLRTEIEDKVSAAVHREIRALRQEIPRPVDSLAPAPPGDNTEYWRCRRSVRCWPIRGPNSDLWGLTGDFFTKTLAIPPSNIPQDCVESIRRLGARRSSKPTKIQHEVLVTFKDVASRDMVFSYASNLARFRQDVDPPGIRLEYPSQLTGVFRMLEKYGIIMRARLGPQFKRSIKFDDGSMSLSMDVLLPGDTTWTKVPFEVASEEVEKHRRAEAAQTRTRFDSLSSVGSNDAAASPTLNPRPASPTPGPSGLRQSTTLLEQAAGNQKQTRWTHM